ncbi:hypothetical protein AC1031_007359 [Aphanomyces cochlioides]|nr:hypothetical protein AC1031_007359 [Aphanomyces cochlioides]
MDEDDLLGLFAIGCELSALRQEKEALRCFMAIRRGASKTTHKLSSGEKEILDIHIAELYLKLALDGQSKALPTYTLPDAAKMVQRVPQQPSFGSTPTSLPFPLHEWSVRRLRCEWMLKILCEPHAYRKHVDLLCQAIRQCEAEQRLQSWLKWFHSALRQQLKQIHIACCAGSSRNVSVFRECAMQAYDALAPCTTDEEFKLWLLDVLCHSLLELPSLSSDDTTKIFGFCHQVSLNASPHLRVYFLILHILLHFRRGDIVQAAPLVEELSKTLTPELQRLPSSWQHFPALFQLQVDAYYDPNVALSRAPSLLASFAKVPRDEPPFLWFEAQQTICHLVEAQGRYSELAIVTAELLEVVNKPRVRQSSRFHSMRITTHLLIAKYAHALNSMDETINHVNAAFSLILAETPEWPHLSDANLLHMMGLLDVATTITCHPLPTSFETPADAAIHTYFPAENLLEFAAGILRDTNLRQIIYDGTNKEVRAKYDLYLCKWLWGTQCLGLVGVYPDMDNLRGFMLSMLQDCLELSSASINCSNVTAEIMVLFGPKLIEFGRLDEGERTLTNALKIAMHTKNLKLQLQIMVEVHASCGRKNQPKSQAIVTDKYFKKLESLARKLGRALENRELHDRLLAWQIQDS